MHTFHAKVRTQRLYPATALLNSPSRPIPLTSLKTECYAPTVSIHRASLKVYNRTAQGSLPVLGMDTNTLGASYSHPHSERHHLDDALVSPDRNVPRDTREKFSAAGNPRVPSVDPAETANGSSLTRGSGTLGARGRVRA